MSTAPLLLSYIGKIHPYVQAGIAIATVIPWGTLQASTVVMGNSVIENHAAKEVGDQVGTFDTVQKTVDLSGLGIIGTLVTAGPGDTIRGSITMKGLAQVKDTWSGGGMTAVIRQEMQAAAEVRTTRPIYGN